MTLLQNFFAKSNNTLKLASSLVLLTSILSLIASLSFLPAWVQFSIPVLIAVFTFCAQFFQTNKVITNSAWLLFAYGVIDIVTKYMVAFPHAQELLITFAGILKLLAGFSVQSPTDAEPPKSLDTQMSDVKP